MIRSNIETDRDIGSKVFDGFKLKAGKLSDRPSVFAGRARQTQQRRSYISADLNLKAGIAEQFADQRGRRGLSVRAGYADYSALHKSIRQFDLADHFAVFTIYIAGRDSVGGHTWRDHDQIYLVKKPGRDLSGHEPDIELFFERLSRFAPGIDLFPVMKSDRCAARG